MNKTTISIFMLLISTTVLQAQTLFMGEYIDKSPPAWYHWIDWKDPNIDDVINKIDSFKSTKLAYLQELKDKQEEDFERDPYEMVFQRWCMANKQYINEEGKVVMDFDAYKTKVQKNLSRAQNNASRKTTGPSNWTNIGPNNNYRMGVVTQNLANVYEIAITPTHPHILYCGTEYGGLFKSINKGQSWYSVGDNVPAGASSGLAVSPNDPKEVYWAQNTKLMYRSLNGGSTWTLLTNFPNSISDRVLVLSNGTVVAGCRDGKVYYSTDKGMTWTASSGLASSSMISDIATKPGNNAYVYATTQDLNTKTFKFYRSKNYGASFSLISTSSSFTATCSRMAVSEADPNVVYVLALGQGSHTASNFISPKLYYSNNSGSTFSLRCEFNGTGRTDPQGLSHGQGYFDLDIEASPSDANMLIAGTTSAWVSSDGGANWTSLSGTYGYDKTLHADIQSIRAFGNDTYITTDGGITYSTDFFQTAAASTIRGYGITSAGFWGFDQGWKHDVIVGGRYHMDNASIHDKYLPAKAGISIGGGESPAGDIVELVRDTAMQGIFSNKGWIYIPTQVQLGYNYSHTGYKNSLYPSKHGYGQYNADFMQHPWYAHTFYLGNNKNFYRSQDMGTTYEIMDSFQSNVLGFDISRTNPDIVFLCTYSHGLYKSMDGGETFASVSLPYGSKMGAKYVDVKIDPEDENIIWYLQGLGSNGEKVFRSTDQGATWTNMTGSGPASTAVLKYLNIQGGTDGGVYITDNKGNTYYTDNTKSDWVDFNNNKSANFYARNGAQIFYSTNKIRMSGNRGIMESPLYQKSDPVALPVTEYKQVPCQYDTVYFADQSIAQYDGLIYNWTFPGATWVSSTTSAYPRVLFGHGPQSVTLKITDKDGKSSTTTIDSMIMVGDYCTIDTVAGKMLEVPASSPNVVTDLGTTDINSNTFSISFWVKPHGKQEALSQMLAIDKCPGSPNKGFGIGFTFSNYAKNLVPCYTDGSNSYTGNSALELDSTRWNNVVLTYSPDRIVLYVNGWGDTVNTSSKPVLDFTQNPFMVNFDLHHQSAQFTGWLDEIKFYDYTLSQTEVREKMHLIPRKLADEPGLVKYVQFNNYQSTTNQTSDLVTGTPITVGGGSSYVQSSSAPVATGEVSRLTVNSYGKRTFPNTNTAIWWASGSTFPNGELVSFELHSDPDQSPAGLYTAHPGKYYIVNNYGNNQTFTEPYYFLITGMDIDPATYGASDYEIYKRKLGDYGQTWGNRLSSPMEHSAQLNGNGYLKFPGTGITSFSQFFISSDINIDLNAAEYPTEFCTKNTGTIALEWKVESGLEPNSFELIRSTDGQNFETIKTIPFVSGQESYHYEDMISDAGRDFIHYYRLRYLDSNQEYKYLAISNIDCNAGTDIVTLWPNPVRDQLSVNVGKKEHQPMEYEIIDVQGRIIAQGGIERNVLISNIDVSRLEPGSYYFRLLDGSDPTLRKFVKIQK